MAGLGGYLAAGIAGGIGEGLVSQAMSRRQEKRDNLQFARQVAVGDRRHAQSLEVLSRRQEHDDQRARDDREFREAQSQADRDSRAELQEADQAFRAGEKQKDRDNTIEVAERRQTNKQGPTSPQYANVVDKARDAATTKGMTGQANKVDYVQFGENLIASGVELKPETIAMVERGLRRQVRKEVRESAQARKSMWKSREEEFGGKTEADWIREDTDRLTAERMTEIGLTGSGRSMKPPTEQNASGQGAMSEDRLFTLAKDKLDRGVDPMKLMERFNQLGLDYSKFEQWLEQQGAAGDRELRGGSR